MRRFVLLASLALSGCGFQPLYGSNGAGGARVTHELQRIYVANIPERQGQELRLALQEQLGGASTKAPDGYTLNVSFGVNASVIDIHSDNTAGRFREIGSAHWRLWTVEATPKFLAEGDVSSLDGFNATFEQYLAQTLNDETVRARLAETLAGSIRQQIATWFKSQIKPSRNNPSDVPSYFDPTAMPTKDGQPYEKAGPDGFPAAATGRTDLNSQNND
ncbi:lipoprotein [Asaia platycodi]|uniref:lipoprotein n=1 Tax=Asaia platycodi TaxID=610243 RepID=UPI00046E556C|nr:lipoprotein [Asaia platycodi]